MEKKERKGVSIFVLLLLVISAFSLIISASASASNSEEQVVGLPTSIVDDLFVKTGVNMTEVIVGDIPPCEQRQPTAAMNDTDGDGLTDMEEINGTFGYVTNPKDNDTDHDGLNDLREYWWCCDPTNPDTNGDTINDGDSVNERITYPYSGTLTTDVDRDGDCLPLAAEKYDVGTDPNTFSSDEDPYGDGQEFFRINMPNIAPADNPLVAAYPILSVRSEGITVTPKEEITSTTGGAKQDAWSMTTETSDSKETSWEEGGTVSLGFEEGMPKGEVTFHVTHVSAKTHTTTESNTTSGWTQEDWSTATTINTDEAATLKFTMNVKNSGTAPAEEITPDINILLGEKEITTVTSPTTISSLGIGETSGNFVVDKGINGDITVTLDELKSTDCGTPLSIETFQIRAQVKKWDGEKNEWVLTGTDYSTYMNEINAVSATILFELGDGNDKEYKVFAGSDKYDPGITLIDAIRLTEGIEEREEDGDTYLYIGGHKVENWHFGFSPQDALDAVKERVDKNEGILNLTLEPGWTIVLRAPSDNPQISWSSYSGDMKKVFASVADDLGIKEVIAHVKIGDAYQNLSMTDENKDTIYIAEITERMVEDDNAYILATDIVNKTAKSKIGKPPTPIEPPLEDGDYVITVKHSNKCLSIVDGSTSNGANVIQKTYGGCDDQKWHLRHLGYYGYYEISGTHSGKCLEVANSRTEDGVNVRQNEWEGTDNQKWYLEPVSGEAGHYAIKNKNSNKCLDVAGASTANDANVDQSEYKNMDNEKWVLQPVDSYPSVIAEYYAISANHSFNCLSIEDSSTRNGANVVQKPYWGNTDQKWELRPVGDGYFTIVCKRSNQCLSIEHGSSRDGANVVQKPYWGCTDQKWKLESAGGDYYKICNNRSYKCLDVAGASTLNKANVDQYEYNGGDNQRWRLDDAMAPAVVLYEHASYLGKTRIFTGDTSYVGDDFNDMASSVTVTEGYYAILCRDKDYKGEERYFRGHVSNVGGNFNDWTSSVKIKSGKPKSGEMKFYEGNDASQDRICTLSTEKSDYWHCKKHSGWNDEARSVKLCNVRPGTKIYVYDDSDGKTDDDWTEIRVKRFSGKIIVKTFEKDRNDDKVWVDYHKDNGLDGKVSYIKVKPPTGW
jgi:hypothetical protein